MNSNQEDLKQILKNAMMIHEKAMMLADDADMARLSGNESKAQTLFKEAFELEREAAFVYLNLFEKEPARSILFRSAASLAKECGLFRDAEKLVNHGLTGNPPDDIAEELREMYEQLNFERHLELKGIKLAPDEVQMSIAGKGIGQFAPSTEFTDRFDSFIKLAHRTAERKFGKDYRKSGKPSQSIQKLYPTFISEPRRASFAVTVRVGSNQTSIDGKTEGQQIIDEVLDGIKLIEEGKEDDLLVKFNNDNEYYDNFMTFVKDLAPDGDTVNLVGFTTQRNGQDIAIKYTRTKSEVSKKISKKSLSEFEQEEPFWISGVLRRADGENKTIKLVAKNRDNDDDNDYIILVKNDAMTDIVRRYFDDIVKVLIILKPHKKGNIKYELLEILRE